MKKLLCFSLIVLLAACQDDVEPKNSPNLRTLSAGEIKVSQGVSDFSFNIFKKIDGQPDENSFISPLSISVALGMLLNGSDPETAQSILNTIDFSDLNASQVNKAFQDLTALLHSMDKKVELGLANSVWYTNAFKVHGNFASIIQEYYGGKIQGLNFTDPASKDVINNWVAQKTNNRIKNLIESISPDNAMFLVNAIYFKGDWTHQFDKSKTADAPFTKLDGTTTPVKMMLSNGVRMNYYSTPDLQLSDIPYGNGQFNFTILMPFKHDVLNALINNLDASQLSEWLASSDTLTSELQLPRFKITWKDNLKQTLAAMGMKMTGFPTLLENVDGNQLEVDKVIHQSFLEVNEEGSEAAAATAIDIVFTSIGPPTRIVVNRPFLFMIREKHTGLILFIGKLVDPGALTGQ